jgi:nucleoside-diphosphate-sugar epimerase
LLVFILRHHSVGIFHGVSRQMGHRIFLAGAAGAVGRRLVPLLIDAGHTVVGSSRSDAKAAQLRALGAEPVLVDVFDSAALMRVVVSARPQVVIHQLTDLSGAADPGSRSQSLLRNARIRDEGTQNLVRAAIAAGAHRLVAQSISWMYAPGAEPHCESDPLDLGAHGDRAASVRGVAALEKCTLQSPPLEGLVLRYGHFYGPGTGSDNAQGPAPLHVDAAAYAALLAVDHGQHGIYNIAEANPHITTDKARTALGWRPEFRLRA